MIIFWILGILAAAIPLTMLTAKLPAALRNQLVPLPALASFLLLSLVALPGIVSNGPIFQTFEWVPQMGVELAMTLNGLGLLLALLVTGIGTLILYYAGGYMGSHPQTIRLFGLLYLFMFSMAGLAMSDHMLVFFIFWELTSISSYFLIGFQHKESSARNNALQALLVTGMGGMALLAGFILLASAAGTWHISELTAVAVQIQEHPHYMAILVLVLLGAFTKSAQFPFHFWLPNAMSAPTPVSAYLHSATMVKAGIFLMFLMLPILGGTGAWTLALATAGSLTLLVGGFFGICHNDLKKILAGTTVAVLGMLTLLLGVGGEKHILAALIFMVAHALYKATLFMVAGAVDHETGTRDVRKLGALRKVMPWTAAAALMAALSKMGIPPFFGFIGKEYTYKASLASEWEWLLTTILLIGNALMIALAIKVAIFPFWRKEPQPDSGKVHEAPWSMVVGPLILALTGVVIGVFPWILDPLFAAAKSVSLGYMAETHIKLWEGLNLPLLISVLTVMTGLLIVINRSRLEKWTGYLPLQSTEGAYKGILEATLRFANWQTRFLQSGYLRNYLLIIIGVTTATIIFKLWRFGGINDLQVSQITEPGLIVVSFMMVVAIGLAVTTTSRLTALLALGMVGYGVAWIFAIFSAPDLAITQILVETLTIVLFAWVIYKLPGFRTLSSRRTLIADGIVSGATGLLITVLVLKSQSIDIGNSISETLTQWSLSEAYGANVVNVILVDFRALDTLGEICVLAIASLGVWALANAKNNNLEKKN